MINEIVETLKKQYMDSSTKELIAIWQTKGGADGNITEEGLEAIRQILVERGIDSPNQSPAGLADDIGLSSASMTDTVRGAAEIMTLSGWSYGTARGVAKVISFVGWLFVGICTVASVVMVNVTGGFSDLFNGPGVIVLAPILIGAVAGFLLVAAGQVLRATVDNADNTGQILALIKTWALEKNTSLSNTKT
ncbi:MAG: hypothetical protein WC856_24190 [Methylococcaceae bacterium]|jgi:hypothetical protein